MRGSGLGRHRQRGDAVVLEGSGIHHRPGDRDVEGAGLMDPAGPLAIAQPELQPA